MTIFICYFIELYKASLWEVGIQMEPNAPIYLQGFIVNFLNLPLRLEVQILEKVWKDGEDFHEIAVHKGNPRFKVNLKLMFWI